MMKKTLLTIIFTLGLFFSTTKLVFAESDFKTSYNIIYQVTENNKLKVLQQVSLTNKHSNIYAKEYLISIGATQISNIRAYTAEAELFPKIHKNENETNITIPFNNPVIGLNESLTFTLEYITEDFANLNGKILEITVPQIDHKADLNNYNSELKVPLKYGEPAFITPEPKRSLITEDSRIYYFSQKNSEKGISAAFGGPQIFDFELSYLLENPNSLKSKTKVALPPNTNRQKVYYNSINPKPEDVEIDQDGNWIASFVLEPKEKIEVLVKGNAQIFISSQSQYSLQNNDLSAYLKEDKYWPVNDPKIVELAEQLDTPRKIYNFLVENFLYDYGRVETNSQRMGAEKALANKDSLLCMEFTDLFITIARASGIPARELNGYAYTNNPKLRPLSLEQDILHSWPEYYDQESQQWIPIDPTWGNTTGGVDFFDKLDYNHFTFVIHGSDSEFPLPAGSYRNTNEGKKVRIKFGSNISPREDYTIKINLPERNLAGLPVYGNIEIVNTGNTSLPDEVFTYSSRDLNISQTKIPVGFLPPYARFNKRITLNKTSLWEDGLKNINYQYKEKIGQTSVLIRSPFLPQYLPYIGAGFIFLVALIILIKKLKGSKSKK